MAAHRDGRASIGLHGSALIQVAQPKSSRPQLRNLGTPNRRKPSWMGEIPMDG
jgi:hypothetical protein